MPTPTSLLLTWYASEARSLPWRDEVSAYRTWISEIMLQQTRVETVIPYFQRFMARFPTVEDLAAAPVEDVLLRWAGLGYYARARNLHAAARQVVDRGGFPQTVDGLSALKGIGPYTAAAIASIAFGVDALAVDGNVRRVVARVLGISAESVASKGKNLLPPGRAGDFNQALMDLGAAICLPRKPSCGICPVIEVCVARQQGLEEVIPPPRKVRPPRPVRAVAGVWETPEGVLMVRHAEMGLLGGLWDLPGGRLEEGEADEAGLKRIFRERLGVDIALGVPLGVVEHVFTHLRWTAVVMRVRAPGTRLPLSQFYLDARFVPFDALHTLALSRLAEKTVALIPR